MKTLLLILLGAATLLSSGCSTISKAPTTSWEGSWNGTDTTPGREGPVSLRVSGHTLEFHGADSGDWLTGSFTLREDVSPKQFIGLITACGAADYIGKDCYAIYKLEDGVLTVAGNTPGVTNFPSAFDDAGARLLVFKHDKTSP